MFFGVIFACPVALKTQIVALFDQLGTVYIVAVAAAHIPIIHLALHKRAVHIYFVPDLPIRKIQFRGQQTRQKAVQEVRLCVGVIPQDSSPRMARGAQLYQFPRPEL
jgi:hypothetical protein